MPEDLDKDHLEDRDDHLGDLNTGLLGRDQVSLITAFPLDDKHDLAQGISSADNILNFPVLANFFFSASSFHLSLAQFGRGQAVFTLLVVKTLEMHSFFISHLLSSLSMDWRRPWTASFGVRGLLETLMLTQFGHLL